MKKFIFAVMLVVGLASLAQAAVEIKAGTTRIGKAETLAITGPTIATTASSGNTVTLNFKLSNIVDTTIYSQTAGSGGNRTVCVSADGKFFSSATACP